jgi:hypothetical protein
MHEIPLTGNGREYPNEYTEVERPLLVQLESLGWQYVRAFPGITVSSEARNSRAVSGGKSGTSQMTM